MNNKKALLILTAILAVFTVVYFSLDNHLYYNGKSNFNHTAKLPNKLRPIYRHSFEGGSSIVNSQGMPIISQYTRFDYDKKTYTVKRVIKYCTVEDSIIVLVITTENRTFYLKVYKNVANSNVALISMPVLLDKDDYQGIHWFDISSDQLEPIEILRNILAFIGILLFVTILILLIGGILYRKWRQRCKR